MVEVRVWIFTSRDQPGGDISICSGDMGRGYMLYGLATTCAGSLETMDALDHKDLDLALYW